MFGQDFCGISKVILGKKGNLIHKIGLIVLMCAVFTGGFLFTTRSWNSWVYSFKSKDFRVLAAVQRDESLDPRTIEGGSLKNTSSDLLIQNASLETSKKGVGIRLGHLTIFENNKVVSVCQLYDKVEMQFRGEGISVSGEACLLIVESDCLTGIDSRHLRTIWIPMAQITQQPPSNIHLTTMVGQPTYIQTKHIGDDWPEEWSLFSIRLFHSESPSKELFFNEKQLMSWPPIQFTWLVPY